MKKNNLFVALCVIFFALCGYANAAEVTVFENEKFAVTINDKSITETSEGMQAEVCFKQKGKSGKRTETMVFDTDQNRYKITSSIGENLDDEDETDDGSFDEWEDIENGSVVDEIKTRVFAVAKAEEEKKEKKKQEDFKRAKAQIEADTDKLNLKEILKAEKKQGGYVEDEEHKKEFEKMVSDPDNVTDKVRELNDDLVYIDTGEIPLILTLSLGMLGDDSKVFYYVDKSSIQTREQNKMSYMIADVYYVIANSDTFILKQAVKVSTGLFTQGLIDKGTTDKFLELVDDGLLPLKFEYSFNNEYPQMQSGYNPNKHLWQEIKRDSVDEEIYKYVKRHTGIGGLIGVSTTSIAAVIGLIVVAFGGFVIYKRIFG